MDAMAFKETDFSWIWDLFYPSSGDSGHSIWNFEAQLGLNVIETNSVLLMDIWTDCR